MEARVRRRNICRRNWSHCQTRRSVDRKLPFSPALLLSEYSSALRSPGRSVSPKPGESCATVTALTPRARSPITSDHEVLEAPNPWFKCITAPGSVFAVAASLPGFSHWACTFSMATRTMLRRLTRRSLRLLAHEAPLHKRRLSPFRRTRRLANADRTTSARVAVARVLI